MIILQKGIYKLLCREVEPKFNPYKKSDTEDVGQKWLTQLDANLKENNLTLDNCVSLKRLRDSLLKRMQIDGKFKTEQLCTKSEPKVSPYANPNGVSKEQHMKNWLAELDANLAKNSLTYDDCITQKERRGRISKEIGVTKSRDIAYKCMSAMQIGSSQYNEYGLKAIDKNIATLATLGISLDECPQVKELRAEIVAKIAQRKANEKKAYEEEQKQIKEAQEAQAKALAKKVDMFYKGGVIKRYSNSGLKSKIEDRVDKLEDFGLKADKWLKDNEEFDKSNYKKKKAVEHWGMIYFNYMGAKFCEKNQGSYDLIEDIDELKNKMSVINTTMPIYMDADAM
jgi:ribosomal protein S20